jgi:hypothetical protein
MSAICRHDVQRRLCAQCLGEDLDAARAEVERVKASREEHVQDLCNRINQILDTCERIGVEMSRDGYGRNARAEDAERERDEARKALNSLLCNLVEGRQLVAEGLLGRSEWLNSMTETARAALVSRGEK